MATVERERHVRDPLRLEPIEQAPDLRAGQEGAWVDVTPWQEPGIDGHDRLRKARRLARIRHLGAMSGEGEVDHVPPGRRLDQMLPNGSDDGGLRGVLGLIEDPDAPLRHLPARLQHVRQHPNILVAAQRPELRTLVGPDPHEQHAVHRR